jgi:integrase
VDAQTVVAISFFLGLRPSEIAGLKWEDVEEDQVNIRRAVVKGTVDETKTPESAARLPLIQPVKGLLQMWNDICAGATVGWVFPNQRRGPLNVDSLCHHVIKPLIRKWNEENAAQGVEERLEWKGLYSGRRGFGTILVDLTGNLVASQEGLRHKSMTTTAEHYKKQTENSLINGMKLLEETAKKA